MRLIKTLRDSQIGIALYSVNGKYLSKFEFRDLEIGIKSPEEDYPDLDSFLIKITHPNFLSLIKDEFRRLEMIREQLD